MHLVLPPVVKLFNTSECPLNASKLAMETIDHLSDTLDFTDYASRIIHPLVNLNMNSFIVLKVFVVVSLICFFF